MVGYSQIQIIFLLAIVFILCIITTFGILVIIGNLSAMKLLAKNGVAVFSHDIKKDWKLLNFVNKEESVCWLRIPEICYSPVMKYSNGKYKKHNYVGKENRYGELYITEDKRIKKLSEFAKVSDNRVTDLTIIKGAPFGNGTDLRHANFSLLRKIKHNVMSISKDYVEICDGDSVRYFKPIALLDIGIDERHSFKYTSREDFVKSLIDFAKIKSDSYNINNNIVFLECSTDIDTVMVILEERNK